MTGEENNPFGQDDPFGHAETDNTPGSVLHNTTEEQNNPLDTLKQTARQGPCCIIRQKNGTVRKRFRSSLVCPLSVACLISLDLLIFYHPTGL